jgi:CBS domain containing-hemolysin-like protein
MISVPIDLLLAIGFVVLNAFFVASEFAIVKIRPTRLEQLALRGNRRARTALAISRKLDAYLSANQLGITLSSLALGWIGEPVFAGIFQPLLGSWEMAHGAAVAAAFVLITFLHTVVGELAPKSLAIQRTEPVALWTAIPLRVFYVVAFPLIWFLNAAATLFLKIIGLGRVTEIDTLHSPQEMRLILQHVAIEPSARRLIDRVFDYTQHLARNAMTLRADTVFLDPDGSFDDNLRAVLKHMYTRYPLLEQRTDRVVGYVHVKDLLIALAAGEKPSLRPLARTPLFFPEDAPLEEIRREMQRRGIHLVIVTGEDGVVSGTLTLEDVVEEFIGEIRDEQDAGEVPPFQRLDDGFEADGRAMIDVIEREVGVFLDAPAGVETIGGLVATLFGRVPSPGDSLDVAGYRLQVLSVRDHRITRIRATKLPPPPQP